MKTNGVSVKQMYYDFIFHKALDRFSQNRLINDENAHALRISQGVSIRRNVGERYKNLLDKGQTFDYKKYLKAINEELSVFAGSDVHIFDDENPENDETFKALNREFASFTGFKNIFDKESVKEEGMIPVSPYSPVFGNLSNVVSSVNLRYISSADVADSNGNIDTIFNRTGEALRVGMFAALKEPYVDKKGNTQFRDVKKRDDVVDTTNYDEALTNIDRDLGNIDDIEEMEDNKYPDSSQIFSQGNISDRERRLENRTEHTTLVDLDDISKLSRFTKYMTQAEYEDIKSWYNDKFLNNWQKLTPVELNNQLMSDKDIEKSIAILDYLDENGYEYKIKRDTKPGQIKVTTSDPKLDIRLSDSAENSQYIGRIYANGLVLRFSTDKRIKDGNTSRYAAYESSPEEAVDLLKYALGETVVSKNGRVVGEYGMVRQKNTNNNRFTSPSRQIVGNNIGYYTTKNFATMYKPLSGNDSVLIRGEYATKASRIPFVKDEFAAAASLKESVKSARENFLEKLDLDNLIDVNHKNGPDYFRNKQLASKMGKAYEGPEILGEFEFSDDPDIRDLQQMYWDSLNSADTVLYKPSRKLDEALENLKEPLDKIDLIAGESEDHLFIKSQAYDLLPEDAVKEHAKDFINYYIGDFDYTVTEDVINPKLDIIYDELGETFDPTNVAKYMNLGRVDFRNDDFLVANLRELDIKADGLKRELDDFNNNRIIDRIIKFDKDSAVSFKELAESKDRPFMKDMYDSVVSALKESSIVFSENNILIDENGVVEYKGYRPVKQGVNVNDYNLGNKLSLRSDFVELTGTIGQIIEPDELGMIKTKFNGSMNYATAPGYTATITPAKVGDYSDFVDRSLLSGYEEKLKKAIKYQIRSDLFTNNNSKCGEGASLNSVLRHLQEERYSENFYEDKIAEGMEEDELKAIISAQVNTVHYSSALGANSTLNAFIKNEEMEKRLRAKALAGGDYQSYAINDRFKSYFTDTGFENLAVITETSDGAYDPIITPSGNKQGLNRVLVDSAKVVNGRIIRGDKDDRAYLAKFFGKNYFDFDPQNRQAMTYSNILRAARIAKDVETAMVDFGGGNFEDGMVVSKNFADTYKVRGKNGQMRSLIIGDKISDEHGDKGVIGLIVDPDMDLEEAREKGIEKAVLTFRNNPGLGVVTSPYAAISRHNGGSLKELLENPKDYVDHEGNVHKNSIGKQRWIITHMNVDAKTIEYDDDDFKRGKGRKASSQLAWAMDSMDAKAIMKEFYGNNERGFLDLREYMITCGLDIDEFGILKDRYTPHDGETRKVFEMPELKYRQLKSGEKRLDTMTMRKEFLEEISNQGGFIEMPFPINFTFVDPKTGKKSQTIKNEKGNYLLPLISSHLRAGQDFDDGRVANHDYTNYYSRIYNSVLQYRANYEEFVKPVADKIEYANNIYNNLDAKDKARYKKSYEKTLNGLNSDYDKLYETHLKDHVDKAQKYFDAVGNDIKERRFTGKHNVFKDSVMSYNLPNSATAVWSGDKNLKIDEVAMSKSMMETLDVKEGDSALIWRDPILKDGGVRYLKIVENNELTGVAINPIIASSFAGDFDGDSVGVKALKSKAAIKEAKELFSPGAHLLNYSAPANESGGFDLYFENELDMVTSQFYDPSLKEKWAKVSKDVNTFEKFYAGYLDNVKDDKEKYEKAYDKLWELRENAVNKISEIADTCLDRAYSTAVISFNSPEDCFKSIIKTNIDTGAKGSFGKLRDTMMYFGANDGKDDGEIDFDNFKVYDGTLASRQDLINTLRAQDVKNTGTGFAGKVPQRVIKALRNANSINDNKGLINFDEKIDIENINISDMEKYINKDEYVRHNVPKSVLESTEPITQAILSAKHNPIQALKTFSALSGTTRALWRGKKVEKVADETGNVAYRVAYEDGKEVTMKKDEWIDMVVDYYDDPEALGVGINNDHIREVADVLADKDGYIRDIENLDDLLELGASPMDLMAYDGNFDLLVNLSQQNMDFYAGDRNICFAPNTVVYNREIKDILENPDKYTEAKYDRAKSEGLRSIITNDTRDYDKELSEIRAENERKALDKTLEMCDDIELSVEESNQDLGL